MPARACEMSGMLRVTPTREEHGRYDRARHNLDRHPTYMLAGLVK